MAEPPPGDSGLTFDWRKHRGEWPRLALWMLVTMFGLAAFFALFRVVYPQSQRTVPTAQQVTLLGQDPATAAVLNAVQDRDFLVVPPPDGRRNPVSLEDRAPVFHPSFEKHELKLLDLPQRSTKPAPVRLLDVREPILPRLDLSALHPPQPASRPSAPQKLDLRFRGELASRRVEARPDFSSLKLAEPDAWRFHVGVSPEGRVVFALPIDAPGKAEDAAPILHLLRQIRFSADPSGKTAWGETSLVWSPAASS